MFSTRYLAGLALAVALAIATLGVSGNTAAAAGGGGGGHGGGGGGGGGFGGGGHGGFGGGYGGFSGGYSGGHLSSGSAMYRGGGAQWSGHVPGGYSSYGAGHYGPGHYSYGSYGHHGWDHYYGYYHHYPYFWGFGWPYWGFGWPYWGFDFGLYYPLYSYVYTYGICPYEECNGYVYQYAPSEAAAANPPTGNLPLSITAAYPPETDQTAVRTMDADTLQFYASAREAFLKGDYRDALRQASHAALESPQNPKVHELMSLALLGLSDYRGAATGGHAALVMGPVGDWPALLEYYGDAEKYTTQLRTLEKYIANNPTSAQPPIPPRLPVPAHRPSRRGRSEFSEALKLTPKDKLAEYVLKQLEAGQPRSRRRPPLRRQSLRPRCRRPAANPSATSPPAAPKEPPSPKSSSPKEL